MVSTRQMSIVGGGSGAADAAGPANEAATSRTTRHSGVLQPISSVSSSWAALPALMRSATCLYPLSPPRPFSTGLLDMPPEVLEKIFSYLKFKNAAHLRMVCRQLNNVCSSYLNSSFQRLLSQMLNRYQVIKSKMPRRESARRSHPLACESDIIETLHMRLALLQMTFGKHIERKYCCFFPGEILDEVYGILEYLRVTTKLARPYKVTDELFDLSTMAMEYFKEQMEPNLPEITYIGTDFFDITGTFSPGDGNKSYLCLDSPPPVGGAGGAGGEVGGAGSAPEEEQLPPSPPPPQSNMVLRKRIHRIKQGMKRYNNQLSALRGDLRSCKRKTAWQQKQLTEQQRQMAEQQKQTLEYAARLDENDKKNEETSRKFQTLLQELNKCRTELQYWRSKSPATTQPVCAQCGGLALHILPPPGVLQHLALDQDVTDAELWGVPTAQEGPSAVPTAVVVPVGASALAVVEAPVLEHPMSPKSGPGASGSKLPGSPKARRLTNGDSKGQSSDEGASKRALSEETASPQDRKKRRLHRTSKPRKP